MIQSITFINSRENHEIAFESNRQKVAIDLLRINVSNYNSFYLKIVFKQPILEFRNHDYTWVKCNEDRIANQFSPKIIKLQNGQIVQANINEGIWEINKKNNTILFWKFNPEYSAPLSVYSGDDNKRIIDQ